MHRSHLLHAAASNLRMATSLVFLTFTAAAADWPQWRGPEFNGATSETNLAPTWSKTENIRWVIDLPGPSAATPAILGDIVFVTSADQASGTLLALAIDRRTGKELWRRQTGERASQEPSSNFASPSPIVDATRAFFYYGNGDLAAFDHGGKPLWSRSLPAEYGAFAFQWTYGASPLLHDGRLYVQVLQRDVPVNGRGREQGESYLLALDPATGKTLWRHVRPTTAPAESQEAYSTPMPFTHAGRPEILITGGDCITGHNPADGRELWRWGTWNTNRIGHWRLVPSPVSGAGVALVCAPKGGPVFAVKAGGGGALDHRHLAWTTASDKAITADVPTPLFYLGDFFVLSDLKKSLTRVDAATGLARWQVPTPGASKYEASPVGADGRIYLLNFRGEVVVIDANDGRIVHQTAMGEPGDDRTRSSIAIAHGGIFVRTNSKLFCVGKP